MEIYSYSKNLYASSNTYKQNAAQDSYILPCIILIIILQNLCFKLFDPWIIFTE